MRWVRSTLVLAVTVAACGHPASPTPATGLTGTVLRGPTSPVCRIDVPCTAPFSAGFTIERSGTQVGQFRSDAAGRFAASLQPGTYRVIPDADAPLLAPRSQARTIEVGAIGLTDVQLEFDTGIR
jgi:hypothetical protein